MRKAARSPEEDALLELLVQLSDDFERRKYESKAATPVELIKFLLAQRQTSPERPTERPGQEPGVRDSLGKSPSEQEPSSEARKVLRYLAGAVCFSPGKMRNGYFLASGAGLFFASTCGCAPASSCWSSPKFRTIIEILRLDGLSGSFFIRRR